MLHNARAALSRRVQRAPRSTWAAAAADPPAAAAAGDQPLAEQQQQQQQTPKPLVLERLSTEQLARNAAIVERLRGQVRGGWMLAAAKPVNAGSEACRMRPAAVRSFPILIQSIPKMSCAPCRGLAAADPGALDAWQPPAVPPPCRRLWSGGALQVGVWAAGAHAAFPHSASPACSRRPHWAVGQSPHALSLVSVMRPALCARRAARWRLRGSCSRATGRNGPSCGGRQTRRRTVRWSRFGCHSEVHAATAHVPLRLFLHSFGMPHYSNGATAAPAACLPCCRRADCDQPD